MNWKKHGKTFLLISILLSCTTVALAAGTSGSSTSGIAGIATNIMGTFEGITKLITSAAYVAGMGFAMASILKFKAHRDNPTQITIGTPIALLFIAAALLFLPYIFGIAGQTVFGTTSNSGITGTTSVTGL